MVVRCKIDTLNTQIQSGGVKLVLWVQFNLLIKKLLLPAFFAHLAWTRGYYVLCHHAQPRCPCLPQPRCPCLPQARANMLYLYICVRNGFLNIKTVHCSIQIGEKQFFLLI